MRIQIVSVVVTSALLGACATQPPAPRATASLESRSNSTVTGRADLTESKTGVTAHVVLNGLAPNSEHGFHVHEKGDCSAADAASAGGHFNPTSQPHGGPGDAPHHAGDLPSVRADGAGRVDTTLTLVGLTLSAGPTSIVGHSLIVHRDKDDLVTQPSGNSGPRVACGVVTMP